MVAAPNRSHAPLAEASLRAGVPVVVDKPLATTAADARRLTELSRETGAMLSVFHNRRFDFGSHLIDQALVLFGSPTHVYAETERRRPGARVDDDTFVALRFAAGATAHLWANQVTLDPAPRFRAAGLRGVLVARSRSAGGRPAIGAAARGCRLGRAHRGGLAAAHRVGRRGARGGEGAAAARWLIPRG